MCCCEDILVGDETTATVPEGALRPEGVADGSHPWVGSWDEITPKLAYHRVGYFLKQMLVFIYEV